MLCKCGQLLLLDSDERSVRTVWGDEIPFSRGTDHVVCPVCLRSYRANDLRGAKPSWDSVEALTGILELEEITDGLLRQLRGDENSA